MGLILPRLGLQTRESWLVIHLRQEPFHISSSSSFHFRHLHHDCSIKQVFLLKTIWVQVDLWLCSKRAGIAKLKSLSLFIFFILNHHLQFIWNSTLKLKEVAADLCKPEPVWTAQIVDAFKLQCQFAGKFLNDRKSQGAINHWHNVRQTGQYKYLNFGSSYWFWKKYYTLLPWVILQEHYQRRLNESSFSTIISMSDKHAFCSIFLSLSTISASCSDYGDCMSRGSHVCFRDCRPVTTCISLTDWSESLQI